MTASIRSCSHDDLHALGCQNRGYSLVATDSFAMIAAFTPTFPDWEERARSSFAKQGLMGHLGASITELEPGRCVLMTVYADSLSQHHGFFHAGVSAAIGDSAGGFAGLTLFDADSDVLTVEFKISLLRPAVGQRLIATGEVLRLGRQLTTCEIRVEVENQDRRVLCATMLQTLYAVRTTKGD